MKVKEIDPDYWQVSDGHKWWTAKSVANFGLRYWHITNSRGTVIDPGGPTGRRVVSAIRKLSPG